ncbi:MAG: chemoreceptor glutamine deamidase CheD, partial [Betaproteobacteria bacterium]|nr:chemoreceptor glutamine deamidase CheD [Betaproteobacteria bacterium]
MTPAAARALARSEVAPPECFATNLYWDRTHSIQAAKLLPGEFYATDRNMLLVTVLGSCVAACIRDKERGIGGMNHFMLPESGETSDPMGSAARYGSYAMEVLINHLLKLGARRGALQAKVFGGGNVIPHMTHANVGGRNSRFVKEFLQEENIPIIASSLEDTCPRKVYYFAQTGKVLMKRLWATRNNTIAEREA